MKKRGRHALLLALVIVLSVAVVGCGSYWPSNWGDLPEFKYGQVTKIEQNGMDKALGNETVMLSQFKPDALAKYKADVKAAGWSIVAEDNVHFGASKNNHTVSVLIGSMDGVNTGFISYSK